MDSSGIGSKAIIDSTRKFFDSNTTYTLLHAIVILMVLSISLYNLTFKTGDTQLWRDLLIFCFGLVIPSPNDKPKQQQQNQQQQ